MISLVSVCNDAFVIPYLTMVESFRTHNSWFSGDTIVVCSKRLCKLSSSNRERIRRRLGEGVVFHEVDDSVYQKDGGFLKAQNPRFQVSYLTLEAFRFDQYDEGVLFVDADILVTGSIQSLTTSSTFAAISNTQSERDSRDAPTKHSSFNGYFNGGVFYAPRYTLGMNVYNTMLRIARSKDWRAADQDSMNEYFRGRPVTIFPPRYNAMVKIFSSQEAVDTMNPLVIHYVGKHKPWKGFGSNMRGLVHLWRNEERTYTMWETLREQAKGKTVTVLGNGPSFDRLTAEEVSRINASLILRMNYAFTDTKSGIRSDVFGWVCALPEKKIYQEYLSSGMHARYVFSPNPQADVCDNRINLWDLFRVVDPLSRAHIRTKKERGNLDLPTIGLTTLMLAVHLRPERILLSGVDLFQEEKLHSSTMDYKRIDTLGSPYVNHKPHSKETDIAFLRNAASIFPGTIEVLHNESISRILGG